MTKWIEQKELVNTLVANLNWRIAETNRAKKEVNRMLTLEKEARDKLDMAQRDYNHILLNRKAES